MKKTFQAIAILSGIVAMIAGGQTWFVKTSLAQAGAAVTQIPKFRAEGSWPKLPNKWIMAIVSSTWIDEQDHLWVLQRPNTLSAEEKVKAAPPVLEFDAEGNFIQGWGGLPVVGTREQVVDTLATLSKAGLDGLLVAFPRYEEGLRDFRDKTYPLLKQAGLRDFV